nr:FAD-dependent oxidoreductase [Shimia sp. R11_0]
MGWNGVPAVRVCEKACGLSWHLGKVGTQVTQFDLVIVGGGAAGQSAALEAVKRGLSVALLVDPMLAENQRLYTEALHSPFAADRERYDASQDQSAIASLQARQVYVVPDAQLRSVSGHLVGYDTNGMRGTLRAAHVLLETGLMERPMPLPGWTLPGVMTIGAALRLMQHGGLAAKDAVLVGSGLPLYSMAVSLLRLGCPPVALVETQTASDLWGAVKKNVGSVIAAHRPARRMIQMLIEIRNAGVPRYVGAHDISLLGDRSVESVHFRHGRKLRDMPCTNVLLHHGVVKDVSVSSASGLTPDWSATERSFDLKSDAWGRTVASNIWLVAGDRVPTGIPALQDAGRVAALTIAYELRKVSKSTRDRAAIEIRLAVASYGRANGFVDQVFPPYHAALKPKDGVTVCRCTGVKAAKIRQAAALGARTMSDVRAFSSAGDGSCGGAMCAAVVAQTLAEFSRQSVEDVGSFTPQPAPGSQPAVTLPYDLNMVLPGGGNDD